MRFERDPSTGLLVPRRRDLVRRGVCAIGACGPGFFAAAAGGGGGDPHWSSVTLLLGFEDGNGATTFDDESTTNFTVTGQDGGAVTTSQFKFGTGSLDVSGTGGDKRGQIASAANAGFAFGSGDFTIECWARYVSGQGEPSWHILDANQTGTSRFLLRYNGAGTLQFFVNGSVLLAYVYSWTSGNWVHLAISRNGTDWRLFVDGVLGSSVSGDSTVMNGGSTALYLGNSTGGDQWGGQIDEVRFTKGVGRYTAAFSPPTAAFPRS